jgi:alpha-tubulin suppressor-like RCC1 family protein
MNPIQGFKRGLSMRLLVSLSKSIQLGLTFTATTLLLAPNVAQPTEPMISVGHNHTLSLDRAGNVYAWGSDANVTLITGGASFESSNCNGARVDRVSRTIFAIASESCRISAVGAAL